MPSQVTLFVCRFLAADPVPQSDALIAGLIDRPHNGSLTVRNGRPGAAARSEFESDASFEWPDFSHFECLKSSRIGRMPNLMACAKWFSPDPDEPGFLTILDFSICIVCPGTAIVIAVASLKRPAFAFPI